MYYSLLFKGWMQFLTTNTELSNAYRCGVNHVTILQFHTPNKLQYFGFTIIFTKYVR